MIKQIETAARKLLYAAAVVAPTATALGQQTGAIRFVQIPTLGVSDCDFKPLAANPFSSATAIMENKGGYQRGDVIFRTISSSNKEVAFLDRGGHMFAILPTSPQLPDIIEPIGDLSQEPAMVELLKQARSSSPRLRNDCEIMRGRQAARVAANTAG